MVAFLFYERAPPPSVYVYSLYSNLCLLVVRVMQIVILITSWHRGGRLTQQMVWQFGMRRLFEGIVLFYETLL